MPIIPWIILVFGILSSRVTADEENEISDTDPTNEQPSEGAANEEDEASTDDATLKTKNDGKDTGAAGTHAKVIKKELSNSITENEVESSQDEDSSIEDFFKSIIKKVPKKPHRFTDYSSEESKEENIFEKRFKEFQKRKKQNVKKHLSSWNSDLSFPFHPQSRLTPRFRYGGRHQIRNRVFNQPTYFG